MNEGQEVDAMFYNWENIPNSLKIFWHKYYLNKQ